MKLSSMTEFVLASMKKQKHRRDKYDDLCSYAEFIKQPLKLEMFVPCGEDGGILEEPAKDDFSFYTHKNLSVQEEFQQAKERVLFKGFYKEYNAVISPYGGYLDTSRFKNRDIESLVGSDLELTETAINQIFGKDLK